MPYVTPPPVTLEVSGDFGPRLLRTGDFGRQSVISDGDFRRFAMKLDGDFGRCAVTSDTAVNSDRNFKRHTVKSLISYFDINRFYLFEATYADAISASNY